MSGIKQAHTNILTYQITKRLRKSYFFRCFQISVSCKMSLHDQTELWLWWKTCLVMHPVVVQVVHFCAVGVNLPLSA